MSLSGLRPRANPSTVLLYDATAYPQPESRSGALLCRLEGLKEPVSNAWTNSLASVRNRQSHTIPRRSITPAQISLRMNPD